MNRSVIETLLGAVVLLVAGLFIIFAYQSSSYTTSDGYAVKAQFSKVDGVRTGTDVKVSGIKIGTVTGLSLDDESFLATITMNIRDGINLPDDTVVSVASEGLMGGSYIDLVPGASEDIVQPGDTLTYTQAPVSLTDMLSRFVFSVVDQENSDTTTPADGF